MPYGRRRFNRRSRKRKRNWAISTRKLPLIAPDKLLVKLRFTLNKASLTGNATYTNAFLGNSIFDPGSASSANQPTGTAEWSNFYLNYRVNASQITASIVSTSTGTAGRVIVYPSLTNVVAGQPLDRPYRKYREIGVEGASNAIAYATNFMSTQKMWGDEAARSCYTFNAPTTANPTNLWFWIVYVTSEDGVAVWTGRETVQIQYYVEFFGRIDQLVSP